MTKRSDWSSSPILADCAAICALTGKSEIEHGAKIEALSYPNRQRNAGGKKNVQEQNSGDQKPGKFARAAVKGKGKGKQPTVTPSYLQVRQETKSESQ